MAAPTATLFASSDTKNGSTRPVKRNELRTICGPRRWSLDLAQVRESAELDVVVELELVGMRSQADRVDFVGPLVVDPGFDEVGGEHATFAEVLVVFFE